MIKNVFVDGVQVNSSKIWLQKLGDVASADVEFATYQRGGANGQILSKPLYRGMLLNMQWFVKSDSLSDFITQRDRFVQFFSNSQEDSDYFKTLGFELANGVIKEVDVLFGKISSDISPNNIANAVFTLSSISEKEFLVSREVKTAALNLIAGGGMAIPMGIPMDMSVGSEDKYAILTNNGNARAYPTIRIYGSFTASFNIINDTTGETMSFTLALGAGDYVDIDLYYRTAIKNGTTSVLGSRSGDWLYLKPGTNKLRLTSPDVTDDGSGLVTYQDSYRNV